MRLRCPDGEADRSPSRSSTGETRTTPTARRTEGRVAEEGVPALCLTLESDAGEQVSLSQFRGTPVVLYVYPDSTSP